MLKIILLVLVAAVAVFLVIVSIQPADFRVTRSTTVAAPPDAVFVQVNDFHKWEAWNPWGKIDPAMKQTYEGPTSGAGAVYTWTGNNEVGSGRMTIAESRPGELVRINMEFLKPMKATHTAEFAFKPQGSGTEVTWSMYGKNNFMAKAIHLFMDMDKMVGGMFEKGLADMKTISEGRTP